MADMRVKCGVCGREASTGAASSLRAGWPKCCGYTMTLESTKEFIEAIESSPPAWTGVPISTLSALADEAGFNASDCC